MKNKVAFLFDKSNLWIEEYLYLFNFQKYKKKYQIKLFKNTNNIINFDIVFVISYTKILNEKFLKKNKLLLIPHPSKIPKDKGFAPIHNAVLNNKNNFFISLIKAEREVDSGDIFSQKKFKLKGNELMKELREIQAKAVFEIISDFLTDYPKVKFKKQVGKSNFNKRRRTDSSELSIKKTILSQFNLLRVCDNERYPAFFVHKGKKYILKIYKEELK